MRLLIFPTAPIFIIALGLESLTIYYQASPYAPPLTNNSVGITPPYCSKTKGENKNEKRIPQLQFHLSYDPLAIYRIQWE